MATGVENNSQCCNWELVEVVCNMIGYSLFIFNVQVELLQICRRLLMAIILQLPLSLYKLKRLVIDVDDRLLPQHVVLPFLASLQDGIHIVTIGGVLSNCIVKCLTMIGH